MSDAPVFLAPTTESARRLLAQQHSGEVVMLNLLRFKDVADYSAAPDVAPAEPISGREAFDLYVEAVFPYLTEAGGEILFMGDASGFFIGPFDEHWDLAMLVRHRSVEVFLSSTSNDAYMKVLAHRTAALADSRLLPTVGRT